MARKVGDIVRRGNRIWLVRVYKNVEKIGTDDARERNLGASVIAFFRYAAIS